MKQVLKRRQRAFTLIEVTLVLAVGMVLILGGLTFYRQAQFSSQMNETSRMITSSVVNIQSAYRSADSYEGLDTASAVTMGLVPAQRFNGTDLLHPAGGSLTISAPSPFDAFMISLNGLDGPTCVRLFTGPNSEIEVARSAVSWVTINGTEYAPSANRPSDSCQPTEHNTVLIEIRHG